MLGAPSYRHFELSTCSRVLQRVGYLVRVRAGIRKHPVDARNHFVWGLISPCNPYPVVCFAGFRCFRVID